MKTILPCMACGKLRIVNGRPEKFIAFHWECSYGKWDCSDPEEIVSEMLPFKICGPVAVMDTESKSIFLKSDLKKIDGIS